MFRFAKTALSAAVLATLSVAVPAEAADMKTWQRAVVKKIAKSQTYPRSALSREIEGTAKVRIMIAADGSITGHEIVKATGEAVLDREIPKLVERLNPLPELPTGEGLSLVLPLTWSLD